MFSPEFITFVQVFVGPLIGLLVLLLAFFAKGKLRDMEASDQRQEASLNRLTDNFEELKDSLPKDYVPRIELSERFNSIFSVLTDVRRVLVRIEDKIDTKQDK